RRTQSRIKSRKVEGTGQAPNQQEVVARRRRLAAKQARRVRATDGAQQLGGIGPSAQSTTWGNRAKRPINKKIAKAVLAFNTG
ncbi:MAG: hypothetical protein RBU37_07190, partial [Myxococcota bacterium]|nr:hypothetical protein [Myxococcota bacterium]